MILKNRNKGIDDWFFSWNISKRTKYDSERTKLLLSNIELRLFTPDYSSYYSQDAESTITTLK